MAEIVILKDPAQTPGINAIEPRETDDLDGTKWRRLAAHGVLGARTNDQCHSMQPRQRLAVAIPNKGGVSSVRVTTRS